MAECTVSMHEVTGSILSPSIKINNNSNTAEQNKTIVLIFACPKHLYSAFVKNVFSCRGILSGHVFCQHVENAVPLFPGCVAAVRCQMSAITLSFEVNVFFGLDICKPFSMFCENKPRWFYFLVESVRRFSNLRLEVLNKFL